jgi:tripartite-type tricarboxylate transporter receptor subunit TctC
MKMIVNIMRNLASLTGFLAIASAGPAIAQESTNFPNRPMRIITGYLPGGVSDLRK